MAFKTLTWKVLILSVLLTINACSGSNDEPDPNPDNTKVDGISSIAGYMPASTKVALKDPVYKWESGDALTVISYNGLEPSITHALIKSSSISEDGFDAEFSALSALDVNLEKYVITPRQNSISKADCNKGSASARLIHVPLNPQSFNASGSVTCPFMLGVSSDGYRTFRFLTPFVALKFPVSKASESEDLVLKSMTVIDNSDEAIWGSGVDVTLPQQKFTLTGGTSSITFDMGSKAISGTPVNVYMYVTAKSFSKGLTVIFDTDKGQVIKSVSSLDVSKLAGSVKEIPGMVLSTDVSGIVPQVLNATSSTVAVSWTPEDVSKKYKVELYNDLALTSLRVGWILNDPDNTVSTAKFNSTYPPRFIFSGLEPQTSYYLIVKNLTDGKAMSTPFVVTTTAPSYTGTVVSKDASAENVILFEDFSKLIYGGDLASFSAGYSRVDRKDLTIPAVASGDNPDKTDANFYTVVASTEAGLFNTLTGLVDDFGLDSWGWDGDDGKEGLVCARPGYLKIGASSKHGFLMTPQLNSFSGSANLEVRFKAHPYGYGLSSYSAEENAIVVEAVTGGTRAENYRVTGYTAVTKANLTLSDAAGWKEYSVVLTNVPAGARIAFGGARAGTNVQSRFMIDDIKITVKDASSTVPHAEGHILFSDGTPAQGVSVSDGFNTTLTDKDGYYTIPTCSDTWYIYFSYPSNAKITKDVNGSPAFFQKYNSAQVTYDWTLEKQAVENEFALFAMADPQAHYAKRNPQTEADVERFRKEAVPGINNEILRQSVPVYGITLGDIVYSEGSRNSNSGMATMRKYFGQVNMPVFQVFGNHDFTYFYGTSNPLKTDATSSDLNLKAQRAFETVFGPINYSFNRGNVHIVAMKDVYFNSTTSAAEYDGGFSDAQLQWLKDDLASVPKTMKVILCVHIPMLSSSSGKNVSAVMNLVKQYKDACVFSGHTHYKRGYSNVLSTGMYEHVHAAVCGMWWWSRFSGDGCPNGYTIYNLKDTKFTDEYFVGYNEYMNDRNTCQMRLYRGGLKYGGPNVYFQTALPSSTLLINIFNGDSRWKAVKVYENGVYKGNATLMTNKKWSTTVSTFDGSTYNVPSTSNQDWWAIGYHMGVLGRGKGSTSYYTNQFHMYSFNLSDPSAKIKVEAEDPYGHVYTCEDVITDGTQYPDYLAGIR